MNTPIGNINDRDITNLVVHPGKIQGYDKDNIFKKSMDSLKHFRNLKSFEIVIKHLSEEATLDGIQAFLKPQIAQTLESLTICSKDHENTLVCDLAEKFAEKCPKIKSITLDGDMGNHINPIIDGISLQKILPKFGFLHSIFLENLDLRDFHKLGCVIKAKRLWIDECRNFKYEDFIYVALNFTELEEFRYQNVMADYGMFDDCGLTLNQLVIFLSTFSSKKLKHLEFWVEHLKNRTSKKALRKRLWPILNEKLKEVDVEISIDGYDFELSSNNNLAGNSKKRCEDLSSENIEMSSDDESDFDKDSDEDLFDDSDDFGDFDYDDYDGLDPYEALQEYDPEYYAYKSAMFWMGYDSD